MFNADCWGVATVAAGQRLFEVGTVATVLQLLKLPDGTVKVLVEGGQRARLKGLERVDEGDFLQAEVEVIDEH